MKKSSAFSALVLSAVLVSPAMAAVINGSATGLASPVSTITFDEVALAPESMVTNQFAGYGVSFAPNVYYAPETGYPNIVGNDVGNFDAQLTAVTPVTLNFTSVEDNVAFALVGDGTPFLISASLNGVPVDSFSANIGYSSPDDFYGFTGEAFNSITLTQTGVGNGPYIILDNVQFGAATSATPEPSSFVLLGTGAFGMAGLVRRRFASKR